jgi:hypothetical protein
VTRTYADVEAVEEQDAWFATLMDLPSGRRHRLRPAQHIGPGACAGTGAWLRISTARSS